MTFLRKKRHRYISEEDAEPVDCDADEEPRPIDAFLRGSVGALHDILEFKRRTCVQQNLPKMTD